MLSEMKKFSIGMVVKHKEIGSKFIDIYPIEHIHDVEGDLEEDEDMLKISKSKSVNAEWLPINTNRVTPPDVRKNETVQIYKYGETDRYYWVDILTELDLRKKETILYLFGNTDNENETLDITNTHWFLVDARDMKIQLHGNNNDKEKSGYDVIFDMKNGTFDLKDTMKNGIQLRSVKGEIEVYVTKKAIIKTNKSTVTLDNDSIKLDTPTTVELTTGGSSVTIDSNVKVVTGDKIEFISGVVDSKPIVKAPNFVTPSVDLVSLDLRVKRLEGFH